MQRLAICVTAALLLTAVHTLAGLNTTDRDQRLILSDKSDKPKTVLSNSAPSREVRILFFNARGGLGFDEKSEIQNYYQWVAK